MFINSIFYKYGDTIIDGANEILEIRRDEYMTQEMIRLYKSDILSVNSKKAKALIYVAGPTTHTSDARLAKSISNESNVLIKHQIGTKLSRLGKLFGGMEYMTIVSDTCASFIQALCHAERIIDEYESIIIYAENVANDTQMEFFTQLGIDIVCSDGIVVMSVTQDRTTECVAEVIDTAWIWNEERSPMTVSQKGYEKVLRKINTDGITMVKSHGTGTVGNNAAEDSAILSVVPDVRIESYKSEIGHTQGASAGIEIGMMIDREKDFDAIVLASGLGNFYGVCRIRSC